MYKRTTKRRFVVSSITLEPETIRQMEELIQKEYKTITKTEFMRFAIEYALSNRKFIDELKEID